MNVVPVLQPRKKRITEGFVAPAASVSHDGRLHRSSPAGEIMMRMLYKLSAPFAMMAALVTLEPGLTAATPSGEALYQQRCASYHDSGKVSIPSKDALKKLSVTRIRTSMDFGKMGGVATTMRRDERDAVAAYLGVAGVNDAPPASAFCADR